jgi:hypothetical protein
MADAALDRVRARISQYAEHIHPLLDEPDLRATIRSTAPDKQWATTLRPSLARDESKRSKSRLDNAVPPVHSAANSLGLLITDQLNLSPSAAVFGGSLSHVSAAAERLWRSHCRSGLATDTTTTLKG